MSPSKPLLPIRRRPLRGEGPSVVELELALDAEVAHVDRELQSHGNKLAAIATSSGNKPGFRPGGGTGAVPRHHQQGSSSSSPGFNQGSPARPPASPHASRPREPTSSPRHASPARGTTERMEASSTGKQGLLYRRLRGTSTRVYYCDEGPNGTEETKESPASAGDRKESQEEGLWALEERQAGRLLMAAMRAWCEVVVDSCSEASAAEKWIDWRRHLRCWRAWRHVVLQEASERAQQVRWSVGWAPVLPTMHDGEGH